MHVFPADASGRCQGRIEFIGVDRGLPGLFEPHVFAIVDERDLEVARLYGNPIEGGGAGAFAASVGPTLTGPAVYVSNADSLGSETARRRDGSARLRRALRPGVASKTFLAYSLAMTHGRSSSLPTTTPPGGHQVRSTMPRGLKACCVLQKSSRLLTHGGPHSCSRCSRRRRRVWRGSRVRQSARIRGQLDSILAIINLDCIAPASPCGSSWTGRLDEHRRARGQPAPASGAV